MTYAISILHQASEMEEKKYFVEILSYERVLKVIRFILIEIFIKHLLFTYLSDRHSTEYYVESRLLCNFNVQVKDHHSMKSYSLGDQNQPSFKYPRLINIHLLKGKCDHCKVMAIQVVEFSIAMSVNY